MMVGSSQYVFTEGKSSLVDLVAYETMISLDVVYLDVKVFNTLSPDILIDKIVWTVR